MVKKLALAVAVTVTSLTGIWLLNRPCELISPTIFSCYFDRWLAFFGALIFMLGSNSFQRHDILRLTDERWKLSTSLFVSANLVLVGFYFLIGSQKFLLIALTLIVSIWIYVLCVLIYSERARVLALMNKREV